MQYDELIKLIKARRSIRSYTEHPVSEEDINKIIEAAIYAPSPTNTQGWRFRIINNKNDIENLVNTIKLSAKKLFNKENEGVTDQILNEYSENFYFFKNAPLVIIFYSKKPLGIAKDLFGDNDLLIRGSGLILSMGMALQNMTLTAESLGLSTCVVTGSLIAEEAINQLYPPPAKYELCGLLIAGYKTKTPSIPTRLPLSKFIVK